MRTKSQPSWKKTKNRKQCTRQDLTNYPQTKEDSKDIRETKDINTHKLNDEYNKR